MSEKSSSLRYYGLLAALLLACGGCLSPLPTEAAVVTESAAPPAPAARSSDAVVAWFTDPSGESGAEHLDRLVVQAIEQAQTSVDVAVYNLSLRSVADALLAAQERGVAVRVVMESDILSGPQPQRLMEGGIKIVGDQRPGLMHNKFLVIDGYEVWTGSANLTVSGTSNDNNNLVRIRSEAVALDYTTEFNEMHEKNLFGPDTLAHTPYPQVDVGGTQVEVYFSPDDVVIRHLLELIQSSQTSIDFLAYTFTSHPLSDAILSRDHDRVYVRGVFDFSQNPPDEDNQFDWLNRLGLDVRLDGIPGLMHHKLMIIDGKIVQTGSYNYTFAAETTNDENVVIIHDPALAAQYSAEFEQIYAKGLK